MKEAQFNTELVNSLRHWGAWAYKIGDVPPSPGLRFTPDKPCDVVGGYTKFFAIESKQIKKFEAFGVRFLRDCQIKSLDEIVKAGNRAFVFLNIRIKASKADATKQENRLVVFDWVEFSKLSGSIKQKDIKALPYVSYQRVKHHKDDTGEIIYDLKPFLESL